MLSLAFQLCLEFLPYSLTPTVTELILFFFRYFTFCLKCRRPQHACVNALALWHENDALCMANIASHMQRRSGGASLLTRRRHAFSPVPSSDLRFSASSLLFALLGCAARFMKSKSIAPIAPSCRIQQRRRASVQILQYIFTRTMGRRSWWVSSLTPHRRRRWHHICVVVSRLCSITHLAETAKCPVLTCSPRLLLPLHDPVDSLPSTRKCAISLHLDHMLQMTPTAPVLLSQALTFPAGANPAWRA